MNEADLFDRCAAVIPGPWRRVEERRLRKLAAALARLLVRDGRVRAETAELTLCDLLSETIDAELAGIDALDRKHSEFARRHAQASLPEERRFTVLEYAAALGTTSAERQRDIRAFERWFGFDAMTDRYRLRRTAAERQISLALRCLGGIAAGILGEEPSAEDRARIWQRLEIEAHIKPLLIHVGNDLLRIEALRCLRRACGNGSTLPIDEGTLQFVYRCALDTRQNVWLQCEALSLLQVLSPASFREILEHRLGQPRAGDELFVRRHAIRLIAAGRTEAPDLAGLLAGCTGDPSPYVRQAVAAALVQAAPHVRDQALPKLLADDPVAQVRASALLQLAALATSDDGFAPALAWLGQRFAAESDAFVLRVGLHVAETVAETLEDDPERRLRWISALTPPIGKLHTGAPDLRVRRWASACRERLWILADAGRHRQAMILGQRLRACPPGASIRLKNGELPSDADDAGRLLSTLTQRDFGIELEKTRRGWRLWRGHRFAFRGWRLLHELRHPSPDKRQAFRHTIGRVFRGNCHIPSGILAELAETKVPGEPLHYAQEDGWRPYLPLVDELISALDQNFPIRPLLLYCPDGITEIGLPRNLFTRLRARLVLTWRFAHYARLRNWNPDSLDDPGAYLRALGELGFAVRFRPHAGESRDDPDTTADPAVLRFFPLAGGITVEELWQRLDHYFVSAFDNSLFELFVFVVASCSFFLGRHVFLNWRLRRARAALPLVIGGWGTRGKSGTERIKAALFNALGYNVVSKTTGCEAMFLHGNAFDELREMFLFRPYDKATIWEQYDVVRLAEQLECEVFLWECMALTPAFVQLLQRAWMRDDLSTLTNTFPDHEDIQGPAGIDIPEVMARFIPRGRTLITSEAQMLPILRHAAESVGTRLRSVDWLRPGLLTPDLLERFPYQEHPDNIALALAVADELGVDEAFAVKEMADRVVPDLGVLKTYPTAAIDGRRLGFVNGMSANERFGCLGNWERTGFDRITPESHPGVLISAVVNNRADRIARSRVFAGVLVADICADRYFLIGSNLHGLQGYIRESWQEWVATVTLFPSAGEAAPTELLRHYARRLRIPTTPETIAARLRAMLEGVGENADEITGDVLPATEALQQRLAAPGFPHGAGILRQFAAERAAFAEYTAFAGRLAAVPLAARPALDADFRALLWRWFERRIVVVEDFHAPGDAVIATLVAHTPPGLENRVMGIQNIKGTGLDFVYRWQAWDTCHRACTEVLAADPGVAAKGLLTLTRFHEFGLLCEGMVRETMRAARKRIEFQDERYQAEINAIVHHLDTTIADIRAGISIQRSSGWLEKLCNAIEGFIDAGDAISRRRSARRIYADLATQRISHARAAIELQALNRLQKGGWLYPAVLKRIEALAVLTRRRPAGDLKTSQPGLRP